MPPPPISLVTLCPPREKECLWLIYIHQSIDLVITIDTFHWLLLSKSPLNQSESVVK